MKARYGYEWQGDNLLLARLNLFNSFIEYHEAYFGVEKTEELVNTLPPTPQDSIDETSHLLLQVANIVSWNIWQMDGLKMVTPMSCVTENKEASKNCSRCAKAGIKENSDKYNFHNGKIAVIHWGEKVVAFEDFLISADTPLATELDKDKPKKKGQQKIAKTQKRLLPLK